MAEQRKPQVSIAAVVVGGLLAGAGVFGLFRVANAEPVPEPPPLPDHRPDPFGTLPVPSMPSAVPSTPLPKVQAAGGIVPPVVPVPTSPTADPTPASPLPAPKPVDAVPLPPPALEPLPPPTPVEPAPGSPTVPPAGDPLPAPIPVDSFPRPEPLPTPIPVGPELPKPLEIPQSVQPVDPVEVPGVIPPVKPENDLRPEQPPLTVNPVPLPPGTEVLPPPRKVGTEELPLPRPVVEESSTPEATPSGAVPIVVPITTPGSTPMTTLSRNAVLSALVGATLAAAPAFAADEPKPADPMPMGATPADPKPVDTAALAAVQKQIDDLKADVKLLKEQKKALEDQLYGRADGKGITPTEKGVLKRLEEAEKAGKEMAFQIKELEDKLAQKTVSEKQPLAGATAGKGIVKLVNEYNTKVSMMVNGRSYPLDVNEVKEVQVPEGELKYELVEFPNAAGKTTTIKEGETVTLRIK